MCESLSLKSKLKKQDSLFRRDYEVTPHHTFTFNVPYLQVYLYIIHHF